MKTNVFINRKCAKSHQFKRNPRKINWTVLYRRKNKKGQTETEIKKKSRKLARFQRAITGATLDDIMKKRNQNPEVRKAQREQAIRAAKDVKKAKAVAAKKVAAAKPAAATKAKAQVPKVQKAPKSSQKGNAAGLR